MPFSFSGVNIRPGPMAFTRTPWGASSAAMPMLFVNGGTDFAYPPDSYAKTYELVRSRKNIRFTPSLPHGHIFDRPREIELFIEHHLRGGAALPRIGKPTVAGGSVTAKVDANTELKSAQLHYTLDDHLGNNPQRTPSAKNAVMENNRQRKWLTKPAVIDNRRISADAPPGNATVWFLTAIDDRQAVVSSDLMLQAKDTD